MQSSILTGHARPIPTLGLLAALAAAFISAPTAFAHPAHAAHASYVSSDPAANAVVKTAPAAVVIHFAEALTPSGSAVTVYDAKGQVVSGAAQVEQNDLQTMRVPMTGDDSEVYLVVWHTTSAADGDPDVGAFSFFVNASGASELAPKPATTGATSQAPTGAPIWLAVLIGIVALLAGLGAGVRWGPRLRSTGQK